MLSRRRLVLGGLVLTGAAAIEPARRLLRDGDSPVDSTAAQPQAQPQQSTTARVAGLSADGPAFYATLSQASAFQGGAVRVRANAGTSGTASIFGRTYGLFPASGGGLEGYVPLGTGDTPGTTPVAVQVTNGPFAEAETLSLLVRSTAWNVEYLEIPPAPPGEEDPLDPVAIQREAERLASIYDTVSAERMWIEPWIIPMAGDITGHFGDQRSINGGPVGGHHGGTDIATPFGQTPGAPIHAANHGSVVLSDRLIVRGNMVIIDHGGGVLTGYGHMLERSVAEGDFVAQGDLIGIEGATGLVTGAHLHWEVAVGGVLVDGLRWVDGSQGF